MPLIGRAPGLGTAQCYAPQLYRSPNRTVRDHPPNPLFRLMYNRWSQPAWDTLYIDLLLTSLSSLGDALLTPSAQFETALARFLTIRSRPSAPASARDCPVACFLSEIIRILWPHPSISASNFAPPTPARESLYAISSASTLRIPTWEYSSVLS